jgi:hypothetical protein
MDTDEENNTDDDFWDDVMTTDFADSDDESSGYGTTKYWEKRYQSEKGSTFEWYQNFNSLRPVLQPYLTGKQIILYTGTRFLFEKLTQRLW